MFICIFKQLKQGLITEQRQIDKTGTEQIIKIESLFLSNIYYFAYIFYIHYFILDLAK